MINFIKLIKNKRPKNILVFSSRFNSNSCNDSEMEIEYLNLIEDTIKTSVKFQGKHKYIDIGPAELNYKLLLDEKMTPLLIKNETSRTGYDKLEKPLPVSVYINPNHI